MLDNREKNKFLRDISRGIPCGKRDKQAFLKTVSDSLEEIAAQNEAVPLVDVEAELGNAKAIAASFRDTLEPWVIKRNRRKRRAIAAVAVAIVAALMIAFYFYLVYEAVQPGYVVTDPPVEEKVDMKLFFGEEL